jgi:hypothetical protein
MRTSLMARVLVLAFFAFGLFANAAHAQSTNAAVGGQITDEQGRVVPGVTVVLANLNTGVTYEAKTNGDGFYNAPNLPPGIYRANVTKDGFKSIVKGDIELHVQDVASINFQLQIGSVSETVTVEAAGLVINTTDATVSTVVDRQFAENLPMNGRSFQTLIELTPGVVIVPSNVGDNGQFSINGQRAASNYWMVDGTSANVGVNGGIFPGNGLGGSAGSVNAFGGTNSLVSVDAMQEFRIQTSTYAPEYGRTPGGQISIVTRSGTNQFHGTLFDYLRNDVLDASDWFNGYTNNPPLPKAKDRQNDFGGVLGGPIIKDRTFFFFSYEGLRLKLPQTTFTTVPDASFTPGGTTNSRQAAIPALQPYLNAFPLPSRNSPEIFAPCDPTTDPTCPPSGQKATGSAALNASYANKSTLDAYSLRIDHKLNDKVSLFGRYNYSPSEIDVRGNGVALSVVSPIGVTTQTATGGVTWAISPTIANDLRFNFSRTNAFDSFHIDSFGGAIPLSSSPFPSPYTKQTAMFLLDIFTLTNGVLGIGNAGAQRQQQINIVDNLSVQRGSHSLKFGVDFRRLTPIFGPPKYGQDPFFSDVPSSESGNLAESLITSSVPATLLLRNLGLYAQDAWRIVPRLTVTYGLRWDVDFVPRSISGPSFAAVTGFNLNDLSNLALAPPGTPAYKTIYGNVAPRIGIAYQLSQNPDWQRVVRGGFGLFYDLASSELGNLLAYTAYPFGALSSNAGGTFPLSSAAAQPPVIVPPNASNMGLLLFENPHLELPYTLEWNVAFEQSLGKQQTLSASYIGAAGYRLLGTAVVFGPNPNITELQLTTNGGNSDYNALQLQFQRRMSKGLQAIASYTWSHSIDTGSAGSSAVSSNRFVPAGLSVNRGPSDFDIRNSFSAGLTYDLPAPRTNALIHLLLSDWSTENFILARSAPPMDVTDSDFFQLGKLLADLRPDSVPGKPVYLFGPQYPGGKAFNPAAFTDPPVDPTTGLPVRQGNVPRNSLRGFGATQWDFAIHRNFSIHESFKLQFRAEMFNVLNHPNFGPPSGCFGVACPVPFGVSVKTLANYLNGGSVGSSLGAGAFSPLYQIGGPRSVQLALRLEF